MENKPYNEGTIKLTWINPKNYKILESSMHKTIEEAKLSLPSNIEKEQYLLFELISTDGNSYKWKLLDGGRSSEYIQGMSFRDNKILFYGSISLAVLGSIYLLKLVSNQFLK